MRPEVSGDGSRGVFNKIYANITDGETHSAMPRSSCYNRRIKLFVEFNGRRLRALSKIRCQAGFVKEINTEIMTDRPTN